jgi:glycerol-3-phosphate dehydrogenase
MGYTPHVLVVGGTPTAAGLARDLALRGLEVTLVARGTLADAPGGVLLDSGARLAARDPERAASVYAENRTLREIAGHSVEDTGGLVLAPDSDATLDDVREGCLSADVPVEPLDGPTVREREPGIGPETGGALAVPDARIDPLRLAVATVEDAKTYGATVETRTEISGVFVDDGALTHATLRDRGVARGDMQRFDYVVDASGPRAGRIATLADLGRPVRTETRPALVANERPTERVLTRPGGPRVVPVDGRCVVTGSPHDPAEPGGGVDGSDAGGVSPGAVDDLLDAAAALVPAVGTARVLRGWPARRAVPRRTADAHPGFRVVDHEARDGLWGLSTVAGATLTTHRLAAERVADQVCAKFGIARECLTATHPLPDVTREGAALAREHGVDPNPVVCPCESVTRAEIRGAVQRAGEKMTDVDAIRLRTGAGMGECQGGQCAHCLAAEFHPARDPGAVEEALAPFLDGRWAGQRHALWGDQLAAAARTYRLHAGTLGLGPERESGTVDIDLDAFEGGNGEPTDDGPAGPRGPIP